jgi:hypothetical protein
MPVRGLGGAARRAEAKLLASESAEVATASMKVANSALEELRELRENEASSAPSVNSDSVSAVKRKKKKSSAGLEARHGCVRVEPS